MFAMCIAEVATCDVSIDHYDYDTWLVFTVSAPLGQLAIPLALLVAVHLPLSCKNRKCCAHKNQNQENATAHNSSYTAIPSVTEWEPPHDQTEEEIKTPLFSENYGSTGAK